MKPVRPASLRLCLARVLDVPLEFLFFDELQRLVLARNSRMTGRSSVRGGWRDARRIAGTFLLRTLGRGERLGRALEFGADHIINLTDYDTVEIRRDRIDELTDGLGADVAVEVTGVLAAIDEGLRLLGKGGRYLVMGNIIPGKEVTIDPGQVVRKSIEVVTTMRYAPSRLNDALSFLSTYGDNYPFDDLIDVSYPLSNVEQALRDSANREVTRAALIPE
jgi:Zn-dependent alcohol dehydrogenase